MSLYNLINGATPATFFVLPMLGKHPDQYPRFRDCFLSDQERPEYNDHIHIYTRTGGNNREDYEGSNQEMQSMPGFVADYDDDFDNTYASWIFKVPEKWASDFAKIKSGNIKEISAEYRAELYRVYPNLKEKFDELFAPSNPIE